MANRKKKQVVITAQMEPDAKADVEAVRHCASSVKKALTSIGWSASMLWVTPEHKKENFRQIIEDLFILAPDCVFNLFEGFGDDPFSEYKLAKLMEESKIVFTGNSSEALFTCLNKKLTNDTLRENGMIVPKGALVKSVADIKDIDIPLPVFIKPCFRDGSQGIDTDSVVNESSDLERVIGEKLKTYGKGLLLEEFIPGDEYNISCLSGKKAEVLGVSIMEYHRYPGSRPFMDYEAKWDTRSDRYKKLVPRVIPLTSLDTKLKKVINRLCGDISRIFGCRGYFRIDIREKDGKWYILDVNPNPDISEDSGFMKQAYSRGYEYHDVIKIMIKNALQNMEAADGPKVYRP